MITPGGVIIVARHLLGISKSEDSETKKNLCWILEGEAQDLAAAQISPYFILLNAFHSQQSQLAQRFEVIKLSL